jgi:hypothetical protein
MIPCLQKGPGDNLSTTKVIVLTGTMSLSFRESEIKPQVGGFKASLASLHARKEHITTCYELPEEKQG